jgi:4-carboxymuconolactone decarboxylase
LSKREGHLQIISPMKKLIFLVGIGAVLHSGLMAQDANTIFTKNGKALEVRHTGSNTLIELHKADSLFKFNMAVASFPAGKKLDWHFHPDGQILVFTDGVGYYQERGKPKRVVAKREVITCLPGIQHWHGASAQSGATYMATYATLKGSTVWLEKVTDEDYEANDKTTSASGNVDAEIVNLSKKKWKWMADKNIDSLQLLFDEKSVFVHMGGSWGKEQEINVIKSGGIWYKQADIHSVSVNLIGNTAILLNNITLLAVVGGNEVTNPFMVTEVYIKENNKWVLGSLSFTKLLSPPHTK